MRLKNFHEQIYPCFTKTDHGIECSSGGVSLNLQKIEHCKTRTVVISMYTWSSTYDRLPFWLTGCKSIWSCVGHIFINSIFNLSNLFIIFIIYFWKLLHYNHLLFFILNTVMFLSLLSDTVHIRSCSWVQVGDVFLMRNMLTIVWTVSFFFSSYIYGCSQ
jgi:hypothetical protein